MTLVVARVTPLGVRVAGDMRITNPNATTSGFLHAELKVILLNPTLCVAYAGNVGAALSAIRHVASEGLDAEEATLHLLDAHERSEPKADFLVASLRPPRLSVIKEGGAEAVPAAWLGVPDAFTEYQRAYHDPGHFQPPPEFFESKGEAEDTEVASRMSTGMRAVVDGANMFTEGETRRVVIPEGGAHPTVGEAIMTAQPRAEDKLFAYSVHNRAVAPLGGGLVATGLRSAELGGFTYFVMPPADPGVGVVGVYFDEGRLGLLYAPLVLDEPERYPGVSQNEFVELVRQRRGISLRGFGSTA